MKVSRPVVVFASIAALAAAVYGGYLMGGNRSDAVGPAQHQMTDSAEQAPERTVLYWHDPMVPQQKFDKPGKSPFMDMDLVPVYADDTAGSNAIRIDPVLAQSLGVRTALAKTGTFWRKVDTMGTVQADERRISVLQSRAAGWLEKLHLRAVDDPVRRGMPVAEIYAPELLAAQEEYLLLLTQPEAGNDLVAAARQRLSLLGLSDAQIRAIGESGQAQRRVVLFAPSNGVVTEIGAREGASVTPGMPVVSIVDLSRVWIVAQVPETQLEWIDTGRPADATVAAMRGETYEGKVEYIYPGVDPDTRTVKVRFSVRNPGTKLRPGMVASVSIYGGPKREVLLVPDEAVIRTGMRDVVIVEESEGRYRAQEVRTGLTSANRVEITEGLNAGDRVVSSGQFLIESEASLRGSISRLSSMAADGVADDADHANHAGHGDGDAPVANDQPAQHVAEGVVKSIDEAEGRVVIAHGPVATLKWPSMTMGFRVSDRKILQGLEPEQEIEFQFIESAGSYQLTTVKRRNSEAGR